MNLSKVSYVQVAGIALFLLCVVLLVASFSGQVKVTVNPADAKADGLGAGAQHISGMYIPDESANMNSSGLKLGAVASLDSVDNPYVSISGKQEFYKRLTLSATSGVPASFPNPFNATSTIDHISCAINSSGLVATQTMDVSTSTTLYGSSTQAFILAESIPTTMKYFAWQPGSVGTTTNIRLVSSDLAGTTGESANLWKPGETLNFRIASGTPGVFTTYLSGSCSVKASRVN